MYNYKLFELPLSRQNGDLYDEKHDRLRAGKNVL